MRHGRGPAEAHEEERGRRRRQRSESRGGSGAGKCGVEGGGHGGRRRRSGGGGGSGGVGGGMARAVAALLTLCSVAIVALGFEPDFLYPLENVTIAQGRDAMFTCVVNNLGGYRVAWIKADTKAILAIHEHVITNNARLSVTHNDFNTWTLNLRDVKREDRGQYMCQVNTDPMKSQTAYLEVVIPPDIIYEETSGDIMVPEGGNAKLVCKARGFPKPKVIWKREDGGEIILRNAGAGKTRVHQVEGEMLSLSKVTRSEMGAYLCIAANGVPPSVSKRMMVHVHFHPMIQVPNQLVGAPQGTDVTLHCHVEASPKAINYWTRDTGEMIIANDKYNMSETSSSYYSVQMRLTIRKFRKADFGGYKCISKNSIGDAEGNIRLYEMELNERKGSALDRDDLDNEALPASEDGDEAAGQHLYNGYQGSLREAGDAAGTALGDTDSATTMVPPGAVFAIAAILNLILNLARH